VRMTTAGFTPETAGAVALARQHAAGDLLRRTALRYTRASWRSSPGRAG
jgi:hypothetical protein